MIEFGEKTRHDHFLINKQFVYTNHGSYGPSPKYVFDELQRLRHIQEENPDLWFRSLNCELYMKNINLASKRLDCPMNNVALVENATVGINAILKSGLPFREIWCTNLAYGAVLYTIEEATKQQKIQMKTINIKFPIISKQDFIQQFKAFLDERRSDEMCLMVLDYITSSTALLFPMEELIELFHSYNMLVLIDGAHAAGQVPHLSLTKLNCDFFVGTFHKWCYASRGCSFLYVKNDDYLELIQPANTSWGYKINSTLTSYTHFHLQFFNQGTKDGSSLLTVEKAFEFSEQLCGGEEKIFEYNTKLSQTAKEMLIKRWNVRHDDDQLQIPQDMEAPYLKMIRLPDLNDYEKTENDALKLLNDLIKDYQLVAIILCVNNELYARISTQIYNTLKDYEYLADIIDKLRKK
ncbi:unnamed protein product [Didymodactylos carnosus]|uniref:Aminotransferase class V domain-containing protein n=1 Tax=Didymodactylos carnosus TaxID=1234261 RepID=A0A8S2EBX8_9BILA|nr:unnamed protein product [Didymodactylos carnosus]CAF3896486.1 unnamed protein product [Didymodactylos carnosus]